MSARTTLLVITALLIAGCAGEPAPPPPPSVTGGSAYFTEADTDAINAGYADYPLALAGATDTDAVAACNALRKKDQDKWAACWNRLLNPVSASLKSTSNALDKVAGREGLRAACRTVVEQGAKYFTARNAAVVRMMRQFDGTPSQQRVAANLYVKTLTTEDQAVAAAFQAVVRQCYSPDDLAALAGSPSPSP